MRRNPRQGIAPLYKHPIRMIERDDDMSDFIRDLYYGNLAPCERGMPKRSSYHRITEKICELEDKIKEKFTQEDQLLIQEYHDLATQLRVLGEEDSFILGFRMGARCAYDAFIEQK